MPDIYDSFRTYPINTDTLRGQPIRVGVWGYYDEIIRNGYLFNNTEAPIGDNLLKPWVDLHRYGKSIGMEFVSLDQLTDWSQVDAILFSDRPKVGDVLAERAMGCPVPKYLMPYECEVIKPDNWDTDYHRRFQRVFTWNDDLVDSRRYIKVNFAIDPTPSRYFQKAGADFDRRKLATVIAGAKAASHPNELYSERIRIIRWFEAEAPQDFDLYGMGWDRAAFPSYRGAVTNKLETLACYRFLICLENAKFIPGYITEKILDALRVGVVPVYGGAPNIEQWIPEDCFIDLRRFRTYGELHSFMAAMDTATYRGYQDRIQEFLSGPRAYPFSIECFVNTLAGFLAHDVLSTRGKAGSNPVAPPTQELVQDTRSLAFHWENCPPMPVPSPVVMRRESLNQVHRDLVVVIGYGDELPVFPRARSLWQFYASHFPGIEVIFIRESDGLGFGEVIHNGHDLLIGVGAHPRETAGYAATGNWSAGENQRVMARLMAFYDYLLRSRDKPFHLFQTTVTSVVDFRGLLTILEQVPQAGCCGGFPYRLSGPQQYAGLSFVSGANTLISSDLVATLRQHYDAEHSTNALPNDVWLGQALRDVPRIPLPLFSFTAPKEAQGQHDEVRTLTRQLLQDGHYHFRVKSSATPGGTREEVDPWVMLRIMETILTSDPAPAANRALLSQLAQAAGAPGGRLLPVSDEPFFAGPRAFPFNDEEARVVYPTLFAG